MRLVVWDWAKREVLVASDAPCACLAAAFNPANADALVTHGARAIHVWSVVTLHKHRSLASVEVEPLDDGGAGGEWTACAWGPGDALC